MNLSLLADLNFFDCKYPNYYIADSNAYTVDRYKAYKLYVSKIPRETTVDEVQKYFSTYGTIKNVQFFDYEDEAYFRAAYVHFESPTATARVLSFYGSRQSFIAKALYCVDVCHTWLQPNSKFTKKMLQDWNSRPENSGEEDLLVPPNRDGIFVLNNDCLENIVRFMPISSQLRFARSCSRACQVFHMTIKSLYRTLILDHLVNLTLWQIRDFFDFAGHYIIQIKGKLPKQYYLQILKFVNKFCINLEEVDLDSVWVHYSKIDPLALLLCKLKKLKTLKLSTKFQVFGKYLENLSPTIEVLSVECSDVTDQHLISLCQSLTNLKELNLGLTFCCNDHVAEAMIVSCQNLETLTVYIDQSNYGLVAKLPNLKNLTVILAKQSIPCPSIFPQLAGQKFHLLKFLCIRGDNGVTNNVAKEISRLKGLRTIDCPFSYKLTDYGLTYFCDLEHLEDINLKGCDYITNKGLMNLILKCKKLKRVNLEGCYLISNDLVLDLIKKMQQQIQNNSFMRSDPVLLMAWFTKLDEDILNAPEYKASSHLVIVELHCHH